MLFSNINNSFLKSFKEQQQINNSFTSKFLVHLFLTLSIPYLSLSSLSAQSPKVFKLKNNLSNFFNLSDSLTVFKTEKNLLISSEQQHTLDSIYDDAKPIDSTKCTSKWLFFDLDNLSDTAQFLYLRPCALSESLNLYVFEGDQLIDIQNSNRSTSIYKKYIPSPVPYLPFHIKPQQKVRLVVHSVFAKNIAPQHFTEMRLTSMLEINNIYIKKAAFQFFYAGIMGLIVLISIVSSIIIKDRAIFYYGMLTFFFIPYFIHSTSINFLTYSYSLPLQNSDIVSICILFIVTFGFLFVSQYLDLPKKMRRFNILFATFSALTLLITGLTLFNTNLLTISNLFIAAWLVMVIAPSVILSFKQQQSAKILLVSFFILVLGAMVFSLQASGLIDLGPYALNAFQIGSLLFSFVLLYALAKRITSIKQEKIKFEEMDVLKTKFFQDISHEIRTPLTLISDPIKRVLQEIPEGSNKQSLQVAQTASKKLQLLVNDILELSTLESSKPALTLIENDLIPLLKTVLSNFETTAGDKQISLKFSSTLSKVLLNFDENRMQKLFGNLLSNALKFTSKNGVVELSVTTLKNTVVVKVKDSGAGIAEEYLPYIFNRYYQVPQSKETAEIGSGIGLALVKEWTLQHDGNITVTSNVNEGTCFILTFPINSEAAVWLENGELTTHVNNYAPLNNTIEQKKFPVTANLKITDTAQPVILIIEDHPDLQKYLFDMLSENYQVLKAGDGLQGIEMALDKIPDLIVSDLMMPKMNGYEVTETLKKDKRTSHIPVILLTARAGQEDKNRGLETGADDYLLKPFDRDELEFRIHNLITQREHLKAHFSDGNLSPQPKAKLNNTDSAFIETIREKLEAEFTNSNFGLDDLAESVAMSKTHLNRKLKALMGNSAGKIIQAYRLKKAKELVENRDGNVGDIAHACGFNSTAYFVKCFKEKYDTTPGAKL